MPNNIKQEYIYVSSDGSSKDIRTLNTEYLINALAKCQRQIYNPNNDEAMTSKYLTNITNIEIELKNRTIKFLAERNK